jgi:hypothetical protein
MILKLSRLADKLAASVPGIPGLAGEGGAHLLPQNAHGTEGRLSRLAAPRAKLKTMQGPRAYAPRFSKPSP